MTCSKDNWLIASGSISILGCHLRLNHFITPSDTSRPTKIRGCPTEAILRATYIQWTVIAVSRRIFCEHLALSLNFENFMVYSRPHSATASQVLVQLPSPQNVGPKPQYPLVLQQPDVQFWVDEQDPLESAAIPCHSCKRGPSNKKANIVKSC